MNLDKFNEMFRLLDSSTGQISQHFFDDFAEENATRFHKMGLKTILIRRQIGKCCEYCEKLVGVYDYDDLPDGIYSRHRDCKCLLTFKTEKGGYVDVWSKKEFDTQRDARIQRIEEINRERKNEEDFAELKNKARDRGERSVDATTYYNNLPKQPVDKSTRVEGKFEYKGKQYEIDGVHIYIDDDKDAERIADLLRDKYGGKIQRFPQILSIDKERPGRPTPDIIWNNKAYDVKKINKDTSSRDCIYNAIHKQKEQAHRFIIDISDSKFPEDELTRQSYNSFNKKSWLEQIILIKNNNVVKIIETTERV